MSEKIAFFLPTRKGSERVKSKNTRPFAGIEGGLVENKIKQLLEPNILMKYYFLQMMKCVLQLLKNMPVTVD